MRSPIGAAAAFGALLLAALPLLVLRFGASRWFFFDEWAFLVGRGAGSPDALLEPYNGHLVAVPLLVFRTVFRLFGIGSYRPYLVTIVVVHLAVVALSRALLRRLGVRPWPANLVVAPLVVFGAGGDNIVWAFQLTFTGAILFALAQLLLADHDGPLGRRDAAGVLSGLLAIACSAVALPLVAASALALLVRRGWRRSLVHAGPPAVAYLAWSVAYRPWEDVAVGAPPISTSIAWLRHATTGTVLALGGSRLVALGLVLLLVVGGGLAASTAWRSGPDGPLAGAGPNGRREAVLAVARTLVIPAALAAAAVVMVILTARTRWIVGVAAARSSRYVYVYAVLLLPALGIAVQAVLDRWRRLAPLMVVLVLAGVPGNATTDAFRAPVFGPQFFVDQRRLATTVVRLPEARLVPPGTRLGQGRLAGFAPTIGFLLGEVDRGRLQPSTGPFRPLERGELLLRLALVSPPEDPTDALYRALGVGVGGKPSEACRPTTPAGRGSGLAPPAVGTRYRIEGQVVATLLDASGTAISPPAAYDSAIVGPVLVVQLPDLRLRLVAAPGGAVTVCAP